MKRALHDLASLAARMGVGGIFFADGWRKLEAGLNATADQFAALQAPLPHVWAPVTMLAELVGGTLLIAGFAVPVVALLLLAEALAVFVLTAGHGEPPLSGGDVELIVALGAASVLLAVAGAGRISADHMVVIKGRETEAAGEFAVDAEADAVIAALRPPRPGEPGGPGGPVEPGGPGTGGSSGPAHAGEEQPATSGDAGAQGSPQPPPAAGSGARTGSAAGEAAGDRPGEEPATTPARKTTPRQRRTRRDDDTTAESRAEAPPAR
ncbi:hypothetical protein GCM10010116_07500 [Microbispora rosea subsp. aerata]|nr:DoxX family protein [Microbispora rosea]GGO03836.1 hypothetical protein GCM10010116_07500 [Microbispora rosea subsp. aerata]GIH54883.1 hypothetical protein Mro02_17970 [Microbispora rosea subsp. aerata]